MSYSFYEVLPYLLAKQYGCVSFHTDFFKDIIKDKEELKELQEVCEKLINAEGDYHSVFKIPAFSRGDKTFVAKTFNLVVNHIEDRVLDDCYEGKTFYHYSSYLTDTDINQKMILISRYYAATDRDLTNVEIYLQEYEEEDTNEILNQNDDGDYSYVLIKGEKSQYNIYGVFTSLENAIDGSKQAKKSGLVKTKKELHIEKVISDTLLLPNTSYTINVLKDCFEAYDYKGNVLYTLS